MTAEPSPQMLLFDITPKQPSPSARQIEAQTEPGSKREDPLPSFLAAEAVKNTGAWHRQLSVVYHGVRRFPGLTAAELTERLGLGDRYICSRRLPELRDRFRAVCNGPERRCTVSPSKHLSQTWYCSRRFSTKGDGQQRISAPGQAAQQSASPASVAGESGALLTPEDRRRFRERLSTEGSPQVKRFLAGLAGGGGGK